MDSQKAANWSQIIGTPLGAIVLGYAVWDHLPTASQSGGTGWSGTMKGYVPPALIALILLVSAILQFIASRRRHPQPKLVSTGESESEAVERIGNQHDQLQGELHLAEKEIATLKSDKGRMGREIAKLEKGLETSRRELSEVRADADVRQSNNTLERDGLLNERKLLNEKLLEAQKALKEETKRANYESNQREEFIKLFNESKHALAAWDSVITHAKDQAAQIDEWVRMKTAIPGKLLLAKSRMVTLEIRIRNESLFPISIRSKDIKGHLRFKAIPLKEEIETPPDEPSISDLEPRGIALIKLQQPLRVFEAERIQESREGGDNDGLFWLGDLYIPVSAKNTPVPVRALPLVIIPEHISLDVHAFSYNK